MDFTEPKLQLVPWNFIYHFISIFQSALLPRILIPHIQITLSQTQSKKETEEDQISSQATKNNSYQQLLYSTAPISLLFPTLYCIFTSLDISNIAINRNTLNSTSLQFPNSNYYQTDPVQHFPLQNYCFVLH